MLRGLRRLNRYEKRVLRLALRSGGLARLRQLGFSRRSRDGFRFPIHVLEVGTPAALRRNPAGLVAGVHGLEIIGIRVLLDFLEFALSPESGALYEDIRRGRLALATVPIANPAGVAMRRRSNAVGVDLMRNSGVEAKDALPFFGGQRISPLLPYYRGKSLQSESRALLRFVQDYFWGIKNRVTPVIDIHSGFGGVNHVWWPPAGSRDPSPDDVLYRKVAARLQAAHGYGRYRFVPQHESYTMHGDLWDLVASRFQDDRREGPKASRLLPWTLEIGTWEHLREKPRRLLNKRKIFNPPKKEKREAIQLHRALLADLVSIGRTRPSDWVKAPLLAGTRP